MMSEIWKDIVGYEGSYEVSNTGFVRRREYFDEKHTLWNPSIIKGIENTKGYLQVCLCLNGKVKRRYVHRLVADAFVPNKASKPQVNHIDGNKQNNNADNLEWCTCKENVQHAISNQLFLRTKRKIVRAT